MSHQEGHGDKGLGSRPGGRVRSRAGRRGSSREVTAANRVSVCEIGKMRGSIGSLPRAAADDARTASRPALAGLFASWIFALVVYFNAFLDAATTTTRAVRHTSPPVTDLLVPGALGYSFASVVATTLPLGALLVLTRVGLPAADRATLGGLTGALIVMFDLATLGNRYEFLQSRELAPLLAALISVGALRIVITAALRRWNVQSRAGWLE